MALLPLVALLTLGAASDSTTIPAGCREDFGTCREDCTIDYGGSTKKYHQLGECIAGCTHERDECTTRHYSLRDTSSDAPAGRESKREQEPWERLESGSSGRATPASGSASPSSARQGVYRASDAAPKPALDADDLREPAPETHEERPAPAPAPSVKAAPPPPAPRPARRGRARRSAARAR